MKEMLCGVYSVATALYTVINSAVSMLMNRWIIALHVDISYVTVYVFICELYEYEIKLNSLDKFSVDSYIRIYLKSVEWFGRWSVQPDMTFPLCIYFMYLVERIYKSTLNLPCLLEWESPWIYIIELYLWTKSRYFLFNSNEAILCQAMTFHNTTFQFLILTVCQHQLAP